MCYSAGSSLDGTIYSIALAGNGDKSSSDFAPSVQTAHEGTRALLRDMVLAGTEEEGGGLVPALLCTEVRPYAQYDGDGHGDGNGVADDARDSVQIRRGSYHTMRVRRISATLPRGVDVDLSAGGGMGGGIRASSSVAAGRTGVGAKKSFHSGKKTVTAASFFGAAPASSKSKPGGKSRAEFKTASAGAAAAANSDNEPNPPEDGKENAENVMADESAERKMKASKKPAAGKNQKKKQKAAGTSGADVMARGSVDDFVGDEDEDDAFLDEEAERRERVRLAKEEADAKIEAERKKNAAPSRRMAFAVDDGVDNTQMAATEEKRRKKETEPVYGAIDAFTDPRFSSDRGGETAGNKNKRVRKKLVEKTFVNERGFIVTEKVEVEEQFSDEDVEDPVPPKKIKPSSAAPARNKAPKNTKGMKQQGLMGFFGAKK